MSGLLFLYQLLYQPQYFNSKQARPTVIISCKTIWSRTLGILFKKLRHMAIKALCVAFFLYNVINSVFGHGYIQKPAARNACWQKGFQDTCGEEWTMDEKNCGGFAAQWRKNGGKCGVCGDPYHEKIQKYVYPGSHASGTITGTYLEGQEIELEVMSSRASLPHGIFTLRNCKRSHSRIFTVIVLFHC